MASSPHTAARLAGRRIVIGLSGGIACYKVAALVSALAQRGAQVTCAMTDAAARFVAPLTFQALSGRPVYTSAWEAIEANDPQHIAIARAAELMLIAPCSMDMLARLATGRTDDIVSLLVAAMDRAHQPVLLAPSMNATMWAQPATQRNLAQLRSDGFRIIEPAAGLQACRTEGIGRLPEPDALLELVLQAMPPSRSAAG
jgi:phosphopantothenoylcysteine decarboxylase/phosphopantothenate--cysteine ligase